MNLEFMAVDVSISVHVGSGICLIALAGVDFTPKTSQEVFAKTSTSYPHLNRLADGEGSPQPTPLPASVPEQTNTGSASKVPTLLFSQPLGRAWALKAVKILC